VIFLIKNKLSNVQLFLLVIAYKIQLIFQVSLMQFKLKLLKHPSSFYLKAAIFFFIFSFTVYDDK